MEEHSTEVVVTVTPEIDTALDAWGRALVDKTPGGASLRVAANKSIRDAIGAAVLAERKACAQGRVVR